MGQLCRVRTRLFGSRSSAKVGGSASDRIQMFGVDGDPLGTAEEGGIPMLDVELSPIGA